jgi:hypothetical protein
MVGPKPARGRGRARPHVVPHALVLCLLAIAVAGCRTTPATLADLTGLEEFSDRFNRDAGTIRIVLLLAPS